MPDRPLQSAIVGAFQNHHLKAYCAYLDSPQWSTFAVGHAKTLNFRPVRLSQGWRKAREVKFFTAADRRLQTFQVLLKSPGVIGLVELRVDEDEADVTQRKDANEKKKSLAPTQKVVRTRRNRHLPFTSEFHGRWLW